MIAFDFNTPNSKAAKTFSKKWNRSFEDASGCFIFVGEWSGKYVNLEIGKRSFNIEMEHFYDGTCLCWVKAEQGIIRVAEALRITENKKQQNTNETTS